MESARDLVALAAKLAAGMQASKHGFQSGDTGLLVHVDRNAAAVVLDGDAAIGMNGDANAIAETRERFVYAVVHNLIDEMM